MNRAERRAIKFGHAFSPMREWYQRNYGFYEIRPAGINQEINAAFSEYCNHTQVSDADRRWDYEGIHDFA